MDASKKFGFKERKDGRFIYRGSDYAVMVYPSKDDRWGIGIHQRRWAGTYWCPLTASSREAAAIYAMSFLADPLHRL